MGNMETDIIKITKALGDPTRLHILKLLLEKCSTEHCCNSESKVCCGNALKKQIGISQPAISQHLKILREAGLVECKKIGYWCHYKINIERIKEYQDMISKFFQINY